MNTQKRFLPPVWDVPVDPVLRDRYVSDLQKSIGAMVRKERERMGLAQAEFAKLARMHANTLGKIERGDALPDVGQLFDLSCVMGVEVKDLLAGLSKPASQDSVLEDADLLLVPGYDVKASAGNGNHVNGEAVIGRYAFSRSWLARKGLKHENLAVVTANGDSMEPTVRSGDILLVDLSVKRVSPDGIYLIEKDNELFCKRLQRLFDGGVSIMSENTKYETQHLSPASAEALHVVGRVIWIGGER